jgi:hypothetical protein
MFPWGAGASIAEARSHSAPGGRELQPARECLQPGAPAAFAERTMNAQGDIDSQTVTLLQDISRNHAAAAADMCRSGLEEAMPEDVSATRPPSGPQPSGEPAGLGGPIEPAVSQEVEDLGAMLRELEDLGLSALCRLARLSDPEAAFHALDDAQAGWLRDVILNRAVETAAPGEQRRADEAP